MGGPTDARHKVNLSRAALPGQSPDSALRSLALCERNTKGG